MVLLFVSPRAYPLEMRRAIDAGYGEEDTAAVA